ncbi:ABC1 family protein-like protein [Neohortaea acidophila]|uniref:ABC1 family protein-like protein n=1 Tax=Neohortaea acidophila TaxID=245834 RepID=A0A6A6PK92_9PEZI|nr:ABC1 family protein-like protein [Neohortaea acidophila]KAF2479923.1 ABC1 family protein-like protein [Neohortaea acidophila]
MRPLISPWAATSLTTAFRSPARPLARTWTCTQCLRTQPAIASKSTFSRTQQQAYEQARLFRQRIFSRRHRKTAITAAVLFVTACAGLAFSERIRYLYIAAERSGRVGAVLALSVNDYRVVLKKSEDPNYDELLKACHKRCAERTLEAMKKNGSIFIKLGQHLTSLNYLLPEEWCDTFIPLQNACPVTGFSKMDEMIRKDTGHSLDDLFADFQREPIGAASLAQVHLATIKETGDRVAVKLQHPSLDDWSQLDLALTRFTFNTLKRFFPEYDLTWLSDEMQVSLPKELDFREEARNAVRAKEYFARSVPNSPLVIPDVLWARRRIVVMEYITGHRVDDLAFLDANGIDRDEVAAALARIFNEMIFGSGAPLHCDPHAGNLAIRLNNSKRRPRNFDIVLYDHGLYRDIPTKLRRSYAHLWLAVIDVDEAKMRHYAYEVAGIGDDEFPIFAAAITGRDFDVVRSDVSTPRNKQEKKNISDALGSGELLEQLVQLLGKVPRIILLILKTNDLTRSLDEGLETRQGPVRSFMILARFAARAVFEESVEGIRGSLLWPPNLWSYGLAFAAYAKIAVKLRVYEVYLSARRRLGLRKGGEGEGGMEALQEMM